MSTNEMIFGDFKVVAKKENRRVLGECRYCGQRKVFAVSTASSGYKAKCPNCNETYKQPIIKKKAYAYRKITTDTKKLICWYFAEGDEIDDICDMLHRNKDEVLRILITCFNTGKYLEYVFLSQIINCQKAVDRMREFKEYWDKVQEAEE